MLKIIKRYWDLLGGAICGVGISILTRFELEKVQLAYSVTILVLVFIGLFKVVRTYCDKGNAKYKRNKNNVIDLLVDNQKPMKAINLAEKPTKNGEELAKLLIGTTKGAKKMIKKFFSWVKMYWQQIVSYIGVIVYFLVTAYVYVVDEFSFILQLLPDTKTWQLCGQIGVWVIVIILGLFIIRNNSKWVGIGSLEEGKEYLKSITEKMQNELSTEAKDQLKSTIKTLKKELKDLNSQITEKTSNLSNYESKIKTCEELLKIGLKDEIEYQELLCEKSNCENEILEKQTKKEQLESTIKKYEEVL